MYKIQSVQPTLLLRTRRFQTWVWWINVNHRATPDQDNPSPLIIAGYGLLVLMIWLEIYMSYGCSCHYTSIVLSFLQWFYLHSCDQKAGYQNNAVWTQQKNSSKLNYTHNTQYTHQNADILVTSSSRSMHNIAANATVHKHLQVLINWWQLTVN